MGLPKGLEDLGKFTTPDNIELIGRGAPTDWVLAAASTTVVVLLVGLVSYWDVGDLEVWGAIAVVSIVQLVAVGVRMMSGVRKRLAKRLWPGE